MKNAHRQADNACHCLLHIFCARNVNNNNNNNNNNKAVNILKHKDLII